MPATAGGRTSGSSTRVTRTSRNAPRRVEIQYAAGVPKASITSIEIEIVSAVTRSASTAASEPSADTSSPGGISRKTAMIGSRRKRRTTLVARTSVVLKSAPPATRPEPEGIRTP